MSVSSCDKVRGHNLTLKQVEGFNLVTTADNRLISATRSNVIMGTWCLYKNVNHPISDSDLYEIAKVWGGKVEHIASAQSKSVIIYQELLNYLVPRLNYAHKTEFTSREWEVIIGPWLTQFVGYVYRRVSTFLQVLDEYKFDTVICFRYVSDLIKSNDTKDFVANTNNPVWQSMVDEIILRCITDEKISIENVDLLAHNVFRDIPEQKSLRFKKFMGELLQRISSSRLIALMPQKYYLQATYLPYMVELRLHLLLLQLPTIRWFASSRVLSSFSMNLSKRKLVFAKNPATSNSIVEKCLIEVGMHVMPTCYIEGFNELVNATKMSNLPENPRVIFTSNSFEYDEIFKVWTSLKLKTKALYVVGQHGNNYGTWVNHDPTEQRTSDLFLSWGWEDFRPNTLPTFNLKSSGRKNVRTSGKGILLIQDMLWNPTYPWDTDFEFAKKLESQFALVSNLDLECRKLLTVRLHHTSSQSNLDIIKLWKDYLEKYPEITLEIGFTSMTKLLRSQQIVVHGYDSTGFLETLALDIPSLAFLPWGLGHLSLEARSDYQELLESGLIQIDPINAANEINKAVLNVDYWWSRSEKITSRKKFTDKYSVISSSPARELKSILTKQK
jgi:putative transferase (TIGR04331 family)